MAIEIVMPKLSDTMTEGKFGAWKKSVGEPVQRGEVIAEVETDKAVMDLEAFSSGVLLEQRVRAGELVPVGAVIGLIGVPSEIPTGTGNASSATPLDQVGIGPERVMVSEEGQISPVVPIPPAATPEPGTPRREEHAAPVVRRRAREMGIDLSFIQGSGPGGRILLEDLERFTGVSLDAAAGAAKNTGPPAAAVVEPAAANLIHKGEPSTSSEQPLSRMRSAIARSVTQAWHEIPHFSLTVELSMDAAEEVRRELTEAGSAVSINDLVIKGSTLALQAFPMVNASYAGDRIVMHSGINIGIAVSLAEGLLVPVLRGCEGLMLKEISSRSSRLVERARSGQLSETELTGGTFSISNLGMFGIKEFTAVIHPPQAAILAVGAVRESVTVKNGQPAVGRVMSLTLSADHRLVDGAYAADFMKALRHNLETPVRLLI